MTQRRAPKLTVILDETLALALAQHVQTSSPPMTQSAVVRDLLRRALGAVPSERSAGFHEGFMKGLQAVRKAITTAMLKAASREDNDDDDDSDDDE